MTCTALLIAAAVSVPAIGAARADGTSPAPERWTAVPSADPSTNDVLQAVSCTGAASCMAVGEGYIGGSFQPIAERWNGAKWAISPLASPPANGDLSGVSCAGAPCMAVGDAIAVAAAPFAELWNGSTWAVSPTASMPVGTSGQLFAVSCPTSSFCVGVGEQVVSPSPQSSTLVEHWNGTTWTIEPSPNLGAMQDAWLNGVACTSATFCVAVGPGIALRWNGAAWSSDPLPSTPTAPALNGVACTSATSCLAVGSAGSIASEVPTALQWDGVSWTTTSTPPNGPNAANTFGAVSCSSATSCTAAGRNGPGFGASFVEQWDGTAWTITPTPDIPFRFWDVDDVTCATAVSGCVGVGSTGTGPMQTLIVGTAPSMPREVFVSWSAAQDARLHQIAAYLGQSLAVTQKTGIYLLAYIIGITDTTPSPVTLPPPGTAEQYTVVWSAPQRAVLDAVDAKYVLDDADATRFGLGILSYLLGLGGH